MHTHTYMYATLHIHMCMHTHTHAHTHTHKQHTHTTYRHVIREVAEGTDNTQQCMGNGNGSLIYKRHSGVYLHTGN